MAGSPGRQAAGPDAGGAAAAFAFLYAQPAEKLTGDVRAGEPDAV